MKNNKGPAQLNFFTRPKFYRDLSGQGKNLGGFTHAPFYKVTCFYANFKKITMKRLKNGAGFTLLELLAVISIISFMANSTFAVASVARAKARDAKRLHDLT